MSFDEAKQILQMDDNGTSLYDHLSAVLLKVITEKPNNAVTAFEDLSISTKAAKVSLPPVAPLPTPASGAVLDWSTKSLNHFEKPDEAPEGVPGPNLVNDAVLYSWAGVSFGQTETYRLNLSLKTFAESLSADNEAVKFWGKISARNGEYYICYTVNPTEVEEPTDNLEGKAGANKYTYFCSKSHADAWVELPNVTAKQLILATKIRRLLTGDLTADVPSYPPFPGNEASLLRAMIGIITAETAIAPAGTFELNEDGIVEPAKNEDGIVQAPTKECSELLEKDGWQHFELGINSLGRCTKLAEPEEEVEGYEPPAEDEVVEPLGGLEAEEGKDLWSLRAAPGGAGQTTTSFVKAVSLLWPGAYAIAGGSQFVNIYVGNGLPYAATTYTPPLPGPICNEWRSGEEEEEPAEGEEPVEPTPGVFPLEQKDVIVDPTPPVEEGEEDE